MNDRFRMAVRQILGELSADAEVSVVLFFGSVQREEGSAGSDLDFYVATRGQTYRRRVCEVGGVVAELLVNPVPRLRQMFADEDQIAINAFATGEVIFDQYDDGQVLVALAKEIWAAGPRALTAEAAARWRYEITALASDVEGLAPDSAEARLVAGMLLYHALQGYCALNRCWSDQPKHLMRRVAEAAPDLARAAAQCCDAGMMYPPAAVVVADRVLQPFGGRLPVYATEPEIYSSEA